MAKRKKKRRKVKAPKRDKVAEALMEVSMDMSLLMLALAKLIHEETGEWKGEFKCPRCHHGTAKWAVAKLNGHAIVICSTKWTDDNGKEQSCTHVME